MYRTTGGVEPSRNRVTDKLTAERYGSSTIKAYATGGGFETKFSYMDHRTGGGSKTGQKILVREGGDSGGLRDLPISRRPIGIGQMFSSTSNLASVLLSYQICSRKVGRHRKGCKTGLQNFKGWI